MPTFEISAQVERDSLRAAIGLTEQLVDHGYVDFARVVDDADPNNPPINEDGFIKVDALATMSMLKGAEAITFLYEQAKRAGYAEGESEARRSASIYQAKVNHRLAAWMLRSACEGDQEIRLQLGRAARSLLSNTPMISPYINDILSRLGGCNLNDSSKLVPLGVLEACRDLAFKASEEIGDPHGR